MDGGFRSGRSQRRMMGLVISVLGGSLLILTLGLVQLTVAGSGSGSAGGQRHGARPRQPVLATPTLVPAGSLALVNVSSSAAAPVRLALGAHLGFALGGLYTLDHLIYDPGVLQVDGQGADGSPLLLAAGRGASYVNARATPRCHPGAPCAAATVPRIYVVFVGVSPAKEDRAIRQAQVAATALARPTIPRAAMLATAAAQSTQWAAIPSPTQCPNCIPRTPAGAGVIEPALAQPFHGYFGIVENQWVEQTPAGTLVIYAGAQPNVDESDWTQGAVFVQTRVGTADVYDTPGKHGSVHIVSAVGETLTLVAKDGATFAFDVPSRGFVTPSASPNASSSEEGSITNTPTPTNTATP